jgi:hypothetical protein
LESIDVLKPSASVLDLDFRRWRFPPYQQHGLGTMMRLAPPEHARWAEWLLRWGGFRPPPDPPEPSEQGE